MTYIVQCDNPDCANTRPTDDDGSTSFAAMQWLHTEQGMKSLDFCSHKCLGEWARQQPGSSTTVVDGS